MKKVIDNFSEDSKLYQKFRPSYPQDLYDFILEQVVDTSAVWDCGTGNGQVAKVLSTYFDHVEATDISEQQLKAAPKLDNVNYGVCRAEKTTFEANTFSLITVAQAIHWFDFKAFYEEVKRVAKPKSILAIWGYGLLKVSPEIDQHIQHFYTQIIGPYWNEERRHIDTAYTSIQFPFEEVNTPSFSIPMLWELSDLEGYLNTWSGVKRYEKANAKNPVSNLIEVLTDLWPKGKKQAVESPIFTKIGRI
ncbi:MAG: class I SAM-dependent methyltransferase [Aureispira sp.]|nr:class I SAM-dependent methyltransferase [Aureispira sp.]